MLAKLGSKVAFEHLGTDINPVKQPFFHNVFCQIAGVTVAERSQAPG